MNAFDSVLFDLAPVPMWLEDLSGLKQLFDQWRAAGIQNLKPYLLEDQLRLLQCVENIKIVHVNQKTLELFEANSVEHLSENLAKVLRGDTLASFSVVLENLWNGKTQFSNPIVNYTLTDKRLDLQFNGVVLPEYTASWQYVLITTENVSTYQQEHRKEEQNRILAEGMFRYSPASLWVEDFSRIKARLDHLRALGIDDFRTFLDVHSEFIDQCMSDIILIDVNQATLDLFGAPNKETLIQNLDKVFTGEMHHTFREQLIELWNGNIHHRREAINYALDGSIRNVLLQFSVFPGYEQDWALVQVSLTDITARKKAESYLEYLGKHDVLTKLYNRSFYTEEIHRLERSIIRPVSCIYLDMNGLKKINDSLGHDTGDGMLRRVGDILNQVVNLPNTVSRIGGDEFVVVMPGSNEQTVQATIESIHDLFHIDNQYYSSLPISIAIGSSTSLAHETIEDVVKRADQAMYLDKKRYYEEKALLSGIKKRDQ